MQTTGGRITRRSALQAGSAGFWMASRMAQAQRATPADPHEPSGTFHQIETILEAEGKEEHGLFSLDFDRKDIQNVTLRGVPVTPAFQINGSAYFQMLKGSRAAMNADFALKAEEINPFIDQLLANNLVFQAEHQHIFGFSPMVWFIHVRATGDPLEIAHGLKAALKVTSTPFPQKRPSNPQSPLPAVELGAILGASPSLADDGVVKFDIPRAETITLGGIEVSPYLNIAAPIAFQPHGGGENAAAVIDFAMTAAEINPVMKMMRKRGWDVGCLYNQETDERPQLYFSHQFKTGDAKELAREMRMGLSLTNSKYQSVG
jgi:hypothetical protein